ncbi:T9SS type A sorting domain-containing protein [candidate division WOR-3 bacterium]|nr:T9SS type A sorting domain-containing protein [candidate division WOR-3 bacterium]
MRSKALVLVAVLSGSLLAATQPYILKYPMYVQGQGTTGTPGTGVPFAVLAGVRSDTASAFYYKPRLLLGTTARHAFWVDSTATGGTPNTWQLDSYTWTSCPILTPTSTTDTARVWTMVKSLAPAVPENESVRLRVRRVGYTTNIDLPAPAGLLTAMDMTRTTGTGGWLAGHVFRTSSGPRLSNAVVLAYSGGVIVGSTISENNKVIEGFDSTDAGFFLMAVKAGQIDSLRTRSRTNYWTDSTPYTQVARPWTVAPGETTWVDAGAVIQGVTRNPQYPLSSENVLVSARIYKTGGTIEYDTLYYAVRDTTTWNRVTHDSIRQSDSTYFYHIPPGDTGAAVYYRIAVWDDLANQVVSPRQSYLLPFDRSIYEIQYTSGDTSPAYGRYVHTAGIVTGVVTQNKTYIGTRAGGPWNGVCLYRRGSIADTLVVGDSVDVLGDVVEFNNLTEVDTVVRLVRGGSGRLFDTTRVSVAGSKLEAYEGVLVRLDTIRLLDGVGGQFMAGTSYRLTNFAGTDTTFIYVTTGSQFVGRPVPSGWCYLVANGSQYRTQRQLDPRVPGDLAELVPDVAVTAIVAPADSAVGGDTVRPTVVVENLSTLNPATDVPVRFLIGSVYNVQQNVAALAPGASDTVVFSPWAAVGGSYELTAFTALAQDPNPANDTARGSLVVVVRDVGAYVVNRPGAAEQLGTTLRPNVRVRNYGGASVLFDLTLQIRNSSGATVYDTTETGIALGGSGYVDHEFSKTWTAEPVGTYSVTAYTSLAGDADPLNDTAYSNCAVVSGPVAPWVCMTRQMPNPPANREMKDGAWLAEKDNLIYAAKGNKTTDFYCYFPTADSWKTLAGIPTGPDNRTVSKGAVGVAGDRDYVYATKGNNTSEFWRYDVTRDSWQRMADVPVGTSNKKVKGGTDLVYVKATGPDPGRMYLLKGYKNEFYRYEVSRDTWRTLTPAPVGANVRWDKGSWLAYHGTPGQGEFTIFAHKAKFHEFYRFDAGADTWFSAPLTAMPKVSRITGKTRKAKDGSSATWFNDAVYAFKGANSQEFWRYRPDGDSWTEMDTIPVLGVANKKKRVKGGADIVTVGNVLYATKGNKCNELWRYTPGSTLYAARAMPHAREGVLSSVMHDASSMMRIAPNPLRAGFATIRLNPRFLESSIPVVSIFDAGGRLVRRSAVGTQQSVVPLDLRGLPAGVYTLRLSAGDCVTTHRLVIQQ